MATLEYHIGERGWPGFTVSLTGASGATNRPVIPAETLVDSSGAEFGTAANPIYTAAATAPGTQNVQGTQANGAAVSANPVLVGGSDGTNLRTLLTTTTGALTVQAAGDVASGGTDSGRPVKIGGYGSSTAPTAVTNGQRANAWFGLNGQLFTSLYDANNAIPFAIIATPADAYSNSNINGINVHGFNRLYNGTNWDRAKKANATSRIASCAATTNATSGKASAGDVHQITAYNTTAAVKYLKLYNKASAPTVGTDTPTDTIAIPPNGILMINYPNGGKYFSTGIAYALTGAAADADTTALAAGDVVALTISYD